MKNGVICNKSKINALWKYKEEIKAMVRDEQKKNDSEFEVNGPVWLGTKMKNSSI